MVTDDGPLAKPLESDRPVWPKTTPTERTNARRSEAEIDEELERIGRDPDAVDAGDGDLGRQNAPRTDEESLESNEDAEAAQEREDDADSEAAG